MPKLRMKVLNQMALLVVYGVSWFVPKVKGGRCQLYMRKNPAPDVWPERCVVIVDGPENVAGIFELLETYDANYKESVKSKGD